MKIFYRPYAMNLTISLMFLIMASHYIAYCFYQQITFFSYEHLRDYLESYYYLVIIYSVATYGLCTYKNWSRRFIQLSFVIFYFATLYLLWPYFSQAIAFYLIFLGIILFYFYNLIGEELKLACYQVNFLKGNIRQKLGKDITVKLDESCNGTMLCWDDKGGVVQLEKSHDITGQSHRLLVNFLNDDYEVLVGPVLYSTELNRLTFRFLSSQENSATLMLIRKLERMGWKPERLI